MNDLLCDKDAPIRGFIHPDTKCRDCKRVLQDCRHVHKITEIHDGYKVVVDCIGFEDCGNT